jgi:predicted nucleotidyltransferase
MKRDDAINLLRQHATDLHKLGVAHACLFGSVARDEADDDSDVDVFITPSTERFSLINLVRVRRFLGGIFGCSVDVFTRGGLNNALPSIRNRINTEIVDAF